MIRPSWQLRRRGGRLSFVSLPFLLRARLRVPDALSVHDTTDDRYWKNISQDAKDFIKRCLTVDPASRITADEAMEHPVSSSASYQVSFAR